MNLTPTPTTLQSGARKNSEYSKLKTWDRWIGTKKGAEYSFKILAITSLKVILPLIHS